MDNRRQIAISGETLWLAPPEYVIISKIQYYDESNSEKHVNDIKGMLAVGEKQIDFSYLKDYLIGKRLWEKYQ